MQIYVLENVPEMTQYEGQKTLSVGVAPSLKAPHQAVRRLAHGRCTASCGASLLGATQTFNVFLATNRMQTFCCSLDSSSQEAT